MAFDLKDETTNELFDVVRRISRKYSSGYEEILKGRLAEQILNVENLVKNLTFKEVSPLVFQMPVFDLKQKLMQPIYKFQKAEDQELNEIELQILETAFALIFAYLSEYKLRSNQLIKSEEYGLIENFLEVGRWNINNFKYSKDKLIYAIHHLVFLVVEDKYKKSALNKTEDNIQNIEAYLNAIKIWDETFEEKQKTVKDLEERLEKAKVTYDFLGLSKGFQQLYEQKKIELEERRDGYSSLAAWLICTPVAVIILCILIVILGFESKLQSLWFLAIPISTLMLFLFYFSRVGLQHVRSIQSQMMQLELRMALCQFIHNYAEDSEKLHAKNKAGFEKFENIIFSPLVSSDDKIPTTFDGMEQLAKLVSEFRK